MPSAWAVKAVARLRGYLEHRCNTPMGIQVFWKSWAKLNDLMEADSWLPGDLAGKVRSLKESSLHDT